MRPRQELDKKQKPSFGGVHQLLSKINIEEGLQNNIKNQKPKHDTYEYIHNDKIMYLYL